MIRTIGASALCLAVSVAPSLANTTYSEVDSGVCIATPTSFNDDQVVPESNETTLWENYTLTGTATFSSTLGAGSSGTGTFTGTTLINSSGATPGTNHGYFYATFFASGGSASKTFSYSVSGTQLQLSSVNVKWNINAGYANGATITTDGEQWQGPESASGDIFVTETGPTVLTQNVAGTAYQAICNGTATFAPIPG